MMAARLIPGKRLPNLLITKSMIPAMIPTSGITRIPSVPISLAIERGKSSTPTPMTL